MTNKENLDMEDIVLEEVSEIKESEESKNSNSDWAEPLEFYEDEDSLDEKWDESVNEPEVNFDEKAAEELANMFTSLFSGLQENMGSNAKSSINFELMNENAVLPKYAHETDAGMDVCSCEDTIIPAHEFKLVHTGLKVEITNPNLEIQVRPRSGLACKHGVTVLNAPGTIDAGYRGEIGVILINHGNEDFEIKVGDRIAQLVISSIVRYAPVETEEVSSDTDRGEGGFGSTGIASEKETDTTSEEVTL